jgi:membrane fusion protein, multidrug efflux system
VTEARHDALLVPQAALTELQCVYQVAIVGGDNKVKIQNVQIGPQVGANWLVNQGVEAGDRVVVGGVQYARQGATVNPMPVAAAQGER